MNRTDPIVDDLSGSDKESPLETPKEGFWKIDNPNGNLKIIHIVDLPPHCNYESIFTAFKSYGKITEIRMDFKEEDETWNAWISFNKQEDAFSAACDLSSMKIDSCNIKGALSDKYPRNLDVYHPADWCDNENVEPEKKLQRTPAPPQWLIATAKGEEYNYFKFSRYLKIKVGSIESGDVSRFGKKSVLIHAKSKNQSRMLSLMKAEENGMLSDIKPHLNFSYGRGVLFNRDLYEFKEEEILEMCPKEVWKVHKIPKTTMIVVTFEDPNVPSHLYIENERVPVRPYKQKPLQCYQCFRFGHPSRVCKNDKLCVNCIEQAHGECSEDTRCNNCNLGHKSNDKKCPSYQLEEAAILKSEVEHITVGYARRILSKGKNYAKAVKSNISNKDKPRVKTPPHQNQEEHHKGAKAMPQSQGYSDLEVIPLSGSSTVSSPKLSSRVLSLPDLTEESRNMELSNAPHSKRELQFSPPYSHVKRGRVRTFSPPSARPAGIPTSNRYEALSPNTIDGSQLPNPVTDPKLSVEVHHAMDSPHEGDKLHHIQKKGMKPNISRPLLKKSIGSSSGKSKNLDLRAAYKESSRK